MTDMPAQQTTSIVFWIVVICEIEIIHVNHPLTGQCFLFFLCLPAFQAPLKAQTFRFPVSAFSLQMLCPSYIPRIVCAFCSVSRQGFRECGTVTQTSDHWKPLILH